MMMIDEAENGRFKVFPYSNANKEVVQPRRGGLELLLEVLKHVDDATRPLEIVHLFSS